MMAALMKVLLGVRFIPMVMRMDLVTWMSAYLHVWRQIILFYNRVIVMMKFLPLIPIHLRFVMT